MMISKMFIYYFQKELMLKVLFLLAFITHLIIKTFVRFNIFCVHNLSQSNAIRVNYKTCLQTTMTNIQAFSNKKTVKI